MIVVYIILFFLTAAAADWLAIQWHEARDNRQLFRIMRLSAIIEAVNWAPIVFAIDSDILSASTIALVNIAGTVIGTGGAMARLKSREAKERSSDDTTPD